MGISQVRMTSATVSVLRELLADPTKSHYGYELMKRTGLPSGTLYPILARLERASWVESFFEEIDPEEGRPPRRHYRLTRDGLDQARLDLARQAALDKKKLRPMDPRPLRAPRPGDVGGY